MPFLLTGLLSVLFIHLQIRANSRLHLMAPPRQDRWHTVATPSSAGLAIFLSCAVSYWLVCPGAYPRIALAAAALWLLGLADDRLQLSPPLKLAAQVVAAAFVVQGGLLFPATSWYPADAALTVFWIVMITNSVNLIDNMDGLCAGAVVIICLFRCWLLHLEGYGVQANLTAILAAAFAGFMVFNYPPARIFMGDCGSMPVGFALGALMLVGPTPHKGSLLAGFFYPAFTFAYPIFDTALVSILRKLAGKPISSGGRDHSSHRLASRGLGDRQVIWILWLLTALGASLGILVYRKPDTLFAAGALLAGLLIPFGMILANPLPALVRFRRRRPAKQSSPGPACA